MHAPPATSAHAPPGATEQHGCLQGGKQANGTSAPPVPSPEPKAGKQAADKDQQEASEVKAAPVDPTSLDFDKLKLVHSREAEDVLAVGDQKVCCCRCQWLMAWVLAVCQPISAEMVMG